jgi:Mg-chelatase subunit ChlD
VVLAAARPAAVELGWPDTPLDLVTSLGTGTPGDRLGLADPRRSAPSRAALLAVDQGLSAQPDGRARLATVLRAADASLPQEPDALLQELGGAATFAAAVSEQAVFAHNERADARPVVASYLAGAPGLDYPFVVIASDPAKRADAVLLRQALRGAAWTQRAQAAGFRAADGAVGVDLRRQEGVDPRQGRSAGPVDPSAIQRAVRTFESITLGTRMLAVIDVSGSMAAAVEGRQGQTRMDLALGAAANGLGLYPDDAHIGLWVFSTGLTPTSDHRELLPIGAVGVQPDGVPGREKMARALADVQVVPHGDTGLYDTTLAAVRAVRNGWDPQSVNSVVLLTDGKNDDDDSIPLEQLLRQLQREAGERPVPVIGIAFGPDSDRDALNQISRATGGTTYVVDDVRRIHEVLADALARRPCRPTC